MLVMMRCRGRGEERRELGNLWRGRVEEEAIQMLKYIIPLDSFCRGVIPVGSLLMLTTMKTKVAIGGVLDTRY